MPQARSARPVFVWDVAKLDALQLMVVERIPLEQIAAAFGLKPEDIKLKMDANGIRYAPVSGKKTGPTGGLVFSAKWSGRQSLVKPPTPLPVDPVPIEPAPLSTPEVPMSAQRKSWSPEHRAAFRASIERRKSAAPAPSAIDAPYKTPPAVVDAYAPQDRERCTEPPAAVGKVIELDGGLTTFLSAPEATPAGEGQAIDDGEQIPPETATVALSEPAFGSKQTIVKPPPESIPQAYSREVEPYIRKIDDLLAAMRVTKTALESRLRDNPEFRAWRVLDQAIRDHETPPA